MNKLIFVFTFFLLSISTLFAQNGLSIQAGTALPVLDYGKVSDTRSLGIGFNGNIKYTYLLNNERFGIYASIDLFYGRLKNSAKENYEEDYKKIYGTDNLDFKYWNEVDIPSIFGFNFTFIHKDNFKFSSNIGAGLNFFKMTDSSIEGEDIYQKTEVNLSTGFGYKLGVYASIKDRYLIYLDYFGAKNNAKFILSDLDETETLKFERKAQIISIGFGYIF